MFDATNLSQGPLYIGTGHTGEVKSMAWAPSGLYVVSGSTDGTVRVWNSTDLSLLTTSWEDIGQVYSVAWS